MRNFYRHIHGARLICLVLYVTSLACVEPKRDPTVTITGSDKLWYQGTKEETAYLLKSFTRDGTQQIEWPPGDLSRIVDISVDVTGSGYEQRVLFQNQYMPMAEYNLHKFCEYASENYILRPGDQVVMRLYGALPNGEPVRVDEYSRFDYPGLIIKAEATIFTRRFNDLSVAVKSVAEAKPGFKPYEILLRWFLPRVKEAGSPKDGFRKSPLLDHIFKVVNLHPRSRQRVFIFITDGQFHAGSYYFSPKSYARRQVTLDDLKREVEREGIKPFASPDPNAKIIFFGLDHGENEEFRLRQGEILRWFFEPLNSSQIQLTSL